MKKVVSVVLMCFLLAMGCSPAYSPTSSWDHMGDADAKFVQSLMRKTVKVEISQLVDISSLTKKEKDTELLRGSGTGTVIAVKNGRSLVLTAGHVCDDAKVYDLEILDMEFHFPIAATSMNVLTIDNVSLDAKILYDNDVTDTCVLDVTGEAGEVALMYNSDVPIGGKVIYTGAPAGVWDTHAAPVYEGRYSGIMNIEEQDYALFSMPVTGGASGAAIYYRGYVVSIVVARNPRFENISFGAMFKATRTAVETALKKWDA